MALITAFDIKSTVLKDKFSDSFICPFIDIEEEEAFCDCIGEDLYDLLVADVIDYGNPDEWTPNDAPYVIDATVIYNGIVYESLTNDNSSNPCDEDKWAKAPKFNTQCYNDLWDKYLKKYLAFKIAQPSLRDGTYEVTQHGLVEMFDDDKGQRTAGKTTFTDHMQFLKVQELKTLRFMKKWMIKQNDEGTCDFSTAKFIAECDVCDTRTLRPRRILFRR